MRLGQLFQESWHSAWAAKIPSLLVAVLVAAMCVTTGMTAGRAAAAQSQVSARMEAAGSRHLTVTDPRNLGFITADIVAQAANLSTNARAVGFASTQDTVNSAIGAGGAPVPTFTLVGEVSDAVELVQGRWPQPGEALVSIQAQHVLGLTHPAGAVSLMSPAGAVDDFAIVGAFSARDPFDELDAGVVVLARPGMVARRLDVIAYTAAQAGTAQLATLALLNRLDPTDINISSPQSLAAIQAEVLGDLAYYNHGTVLLVLLAGAALIAVIALADVLLRRSEIGRRRALGIPRWALIALLVVRSVYAAIIGAGLGSAVAVILVVRSGQGVSIQFTVATALLALVATALATTVPAITAAHQDPVRVLRTP